MLIEPRELGKILFEFETERQSFYKQYTLKKFLSWQVIRRPLYYSLIWQRFFESSSKTAKKSTGTYLIAMIKFPFRVIYLLLKKRKVRAFIVANEVYKLEKNAGGKDINVFTDHWYYMFKPSQVLLMEDRWGKRDRKKSNIKPDLDTVVFKFLTRTVTWILKRIKWSHRLTKSMQEELTSFFESKNILFPESSRIINDIIIKFLVDYYVYRFLFVLFRPGVLIAADSMGRGMMAAAKRTGVKVIELQHGLLDTYKPDYMISETLNVYRKQLILPDRIAVFGDYYKSFLTRGGFWTGNEIISVGNTRVDNYRGKRMVATEAVAEKTVLIPTQWNYFTETKKLLQQLEKASKNVSFRMFIKTHPREPKKQVDFYKRFCSEYPGAILYGNEISIYDLFIKSDLVIGFDSTSLLESLALGIPTVTVSTKTSPKGLHSYNADTILESSIKVADIETIKDLVEKTFSDKKFLETWEGQIVQASDYVYKKNCLENCKDILDKL